MNQDFDCEFLGNLRFGTRRTARPPKETPQRRDAPYGAAHVRREPKEKIKAQKIQSTRSPECFELGENTKKTRETVIRKRWDLIPEACSSYRFYL